MSEEKINKEFDTKATEKSWTKGQAMDAMEQRVQEQLAYPQNQALLEKMIDKYGTTAQQAKIASVKASSLATGAAAGTANATTGAINVVTGSFNFVTGVFGVPEIPDIPEVENPVQLQEVLTDAAVDISREQIGTIFTHSGRDTLSVDEINSKLTEMGQQNEMFQNYTADNGEQLSPVEKTILEHNTNHASIDTPYTPPEGMEKGFDLATSP